MQLTKLVINSHRHLQNITLDCTYPEGHEKAGKPLEKICIIGQSATGKTSILELLKDTMTMLSKTEVLNRNELLKYEGLNFEGYIEFFYENQLLIINPKNVVKNGVIHGLQYSSSGAVGPLIEDANIIYFASELIAGDSIEILNQHPLDFTEHTLPSKTDLFKYPIEFPSKSTKDLWLSLLAKVLTYRKDFLQMASLLINQGTISDLEKVNRRVQNWQLQNENPLESFAFNFNPILKKLSLEIDLANMEYFIPIKSIITDEVIPIKGLSTGTKNLLLSFFPLFHLDTQDGLVMIDEPERSLFPDLQVDLLSHYKRLAPNAQFIVATHSPFIAASFEPEERFILFFNEDGKVEVRRGVSPIGDDPNDILENDFGVDYNNEFGKKAYRKYVSLKKQVKEESNPIKKQELANDLAALGDKYNF